MDMVRTVADALAKARGVKIFDEVDQQLFERDARAAIEAMREPPRDVLTAFVDADVDTFVAGVRWEAAIDTALTPSPASK